MKCRKLVLGMGCSGVLYSVQNPTACLLFLNRFLHVRAELGEETLSPAVLHGVYQQFSIVAFTFFPVLEEIIVKLAS